MSTAETLELSPQQIAAHDDQRDLGQRGSASLIEFFKEAFPAGSWLLDAGGGSGVTVPALQACGSRVVVLDWSRSMLAAAGARTRHRCAGDLRRLPFPDGVFGGVHAAYAIQNVSDWQQALSECARVANATAPIVIVWGSAPADERLAGIESAYLEALGPAAGVRAERTGLTVEAATDLLASLDRPLQRTVAVAGEQVRTARQVVERVALNPYRSQPTEDARAHAVDTALAWAAANVARPDEALRLPIVRVHHVYGLSRDARGSRGPHL